MTKYIVREKHGDYWEEFESQHEAENELAFMTETDSEFWKADEDKYEIVKVQM